MAKKWPDTEAFVAVCNKMDKGEPFLLEDAMDVFGTEFSITLVYALMEAGDAARAIQSAMNRLKAGEKTDEAPDIPPSLQ